MRRDARLDLTHPEAMDHGAHLEIRTPMRVGTRVLLTGLAFIPLLAPFELLIRIHWARYLSPLFVFAAIVSAGAAAVSALLLFAALAGLSSTMAFDKRAATFSYLTHAPLGGRNRQAYPLSDVRNVEVGLRDWSDSAPSYHLKVTLNDGAVFESGSSCSHDDIVSLQSSVIAFLADRGG